METIYPAIYSTFCDRVKTLEFPTTTRISELLQTIIRETVRAQKKKQQTPKLVRYPSKHDCRAWYQDQWLSNPTFERFKPFELVTCFNNTRSSSGVLPLTLCLDGRAMKSCAYACSFCPLETKEKGGQEDMVQSYHSSESVPIMARIENFDMVRQFLHRAFCYEDQGEQVAKIECILLGGTWHSFPQSYRDSVIHDIYYACNLFEHFSLWGPKNHSRTGFYYSHVKQWLDQNCHLANTKKASILSCIPLDEIMKLYPKQPTLEQEKAINENVGACVISIVIETRPDQFTSHESVLELRRYGVTRVQLGIQHLNDNVLKVNNRQHTTKETAKGIKTLLDAGFKVSGHLMLDLPGSTSKDDVEMMDEFQTSDKFRVDGLKLYTCQVVKYAPLEKWVQKGKELLAQNNMDAIQGIQFLMNQGEWVPDQAKIWLPRSEHDFKQLLQDHVYAMTRINPTIRVDRLLRDFAEANESNNFIGFESENLTLNLRQMVEDRLDALEKKDFSRDIRSREVGDDFHVSNFKKFRFYIRRFRASDGCEFFLSIEVPKHIGSDSDPFLEDATLLGLLRLRIPDVSKSPFVIRMGEFKNQDTAIVREIHVYGTMISVHEKDHTGTGVQHCGIGTFLLKAAEHVAQTFDHVKKIAVISGVGVVNYYRNRGYQKGSLENGEYMVKPFGNQECQECKEPLSLLGRTFFPLEIMDAARITYKNPSPNTFVYGPRWPGATRVIL